ncbi:MAG: DUF4012 domain-containing protein [Acidimicrobiales bacterium]
MATRTRRRVLLPLAAAFVVLWLAYCGWLLLGARRSMQHGERALRAVRAKGSVAALVAPGTRRDLDDAHRRFAAAEQKTSSPALLPLRVLPVLGRNVRAADRLATAGADGTAVASTALDRLAVLTGRPQAAGQARLDTLADLASLADRARADLDGIDVGSSKGLVGPLHDAVEQVADHQRSAAAGATELRDVSTALRSVLAGGQPYLLLGANNAEMRNGSGMFLSATELGFDGGHLRLGEVRPTADLVRPRGSVPVGGDLQANWAWLDPGSDLRNLAVTADFPQSARAAARNWEDVPGGGTVAGVIVVDVDALRGLLRVVGPVEVGGVRYTADTVRGELLRRQYERFGSDRDARRDELGAVARAVFAKIEAGRWDTAALATELSDAVAGRHLLVWSADPTAQRAWARAGADGHLTDRSVSVGVINRGATKLDSWIDDATTVDVEGGGDGGRARITVTVTLRNRAPAAGPRYVVGPNVAGASEGDHTALVVVNLPAGTTGVRLAGAKEFLRGGDGPTVVVGGQLVVRRGAVGQVTVTGLLPAGIDHLVVEPSARIPKVRWEVAGEELGRDRRRSIPVGR